MCGFPTSALVAAATLVHRYITDRFLPDKAIDLMDEAARRLRMEVDSKPEELDALDREILQKQIEAEALKKEDDAGLERSSGEAGERAWRLAGEIRRDDGAMAGRAGQAGRSRDTQGTARPCAAELDIAKREGNLAKAGELSYGVIPSWKKLAEAEGAKT